MSASYRERFQEYFSRDVAQRAAKSLSDSAQIEFVLPGETFTFTKNGDKNVVQTGAASEPQIRFRVPAAAAERILSDTSDDVGTLGIGILKLVLETNAEHRIHFEVHAGFLKLFTLGYFGVLTSGGSAFASFLAQHGLNGIDAIKSALKRVKNSV